MPSRSRLAIALLALALGGCGGLTRLQAPNLSIISLQVEKSDLLEQRLKLRMRVQNPNDRELPVKGLSYTVEVAGEDFGRGVSGAGFVVPAFGEAEFDMFLTTNLAGGLIRLLGTLNDSQRDALDYRIVGKVSLASGFLRSIPFEEKGQFRLN
ncbi:MAG: LEA type 2 family protein [Steroidobacteraceae bacterium]